MLTEEQIKQFALQAGIDITSDTLCRFEGWEAPMQQFARAIEQAVRKEIGADPERLDWCIKVLMNGDSSYITTDVGCGCCGDGIRFDRKMDGRAAIDAARGQT